MVEQGRAVSPPASIAAHCYCLFLTPSRTLPEPVGDRTKRLEELVSH